MRRIICLFLLVLVVPILSQGQTCGNVDGIGGINSSDAIWLYEQLLLPARPASFGNGDVDGRAGVTLSDVIRLYDRTFFGTSIDCSASLAYSFGASDQDTIFVPYMSQIPDDIDSVVLYMGYSITQPVRGIYLPLLTHGPMATSNFRLSHVSDIDLGAVLSCDREYLTDIDTVVMTYGGFPVAGRRFLGKLTYVRTAPGIGSIQPMPVDRDALLRVSVERNSDLFLPELAPYQVPVPPDSLIVSGSLQFTELQGESSSYAALHFATNSQQTAFRLRGSDWWISVPFNGWAMTPQSVIFRVNTTTLDPGVHNGYVFVEAEDSNILVTRDSVPVYLYVQPKRVSQNGDLNCDDLIDLSDLAWLIAYLTAYGPLPQSCF